MVSLVLLPNVFFADIRKSNAIRV